MEFSDQQTIHFKNCGASAKLERVDEGIYMLRNLWAKIRREGMATDILREINYFADQNDLIVLLVAQGYGRGGPDNARLEALYRKVGYVRLGQPRGVRKMVRYPSPM